MLSPDRFPCFQCFRIFSAAAFAAVSGPFLRVDAQSVRRAVVPCASPRKYVLVHMYCHRPWRGGARSAGRANHLSPPATSPVSTRGDAPPISGVCIVTVRLRIVAHRSVLPNATDPSDPTPQGGVPGTARMDAVPVRRITVRSIHAIRQGPASQLPAVVALCPFFFFRLTANLYSIPSSFFFLPPSNTIFPPAIAPLRAFHRSRGCDRLRFDCSCCLPLPSDCHHSFWRRQF